MANRFSAGEPYYGSRETEILKNGNVGDKWQIGFAIYKIVKKKGKKSFKLLKEKGSKYYEVYTKV